jgi:hypothetical protein
MTEVHFYKPDLTSNMAPQAITFASNYGAAMTIHQDGRITLGAGADPTEAAAQCIEAMSGMIQSMIENAVDAREALIVAWLRKRRMHHIPTLIENRHHLR